jgi:hypothetical protein
VYGFCGMILGEIAHPFALIEFFHPAFSNWFSVTYFLKD